MDMHHTETLLPNRKGNPQEVKKRKKLKLHKSKSFKCGDEMVLLWRDKRNVLMVSNYYDNTMEEVSRKTAATTEKFLKPKLIVEYTKNMGGVDTSDHYYASYSFLRKSVKWWRKMFFWMLETAIVNSYIGYKETSEREGKRPQSHLQFRRALLVQLVGGLRNPTKQKRGKPGTRDKEERLNGKPHFVVHIEETHKDCAVCSNRKIQVGKKKRTIFVKRAAGSQVYIPEVALNVTTPWKNINHISHVTFKGKSTIYLMNVVCCLSFFFNQ